jgi:hypothetical protein
MTDILELAREAGLGAVLCHGSVEGDRVWIEGADWHDELERFAELLEAKVRADMTNVINNGKTAFPIIGQLQDVREKGMTLRDYFAAKAMEVNLYKCECFPDEHWRIGVALDSYAMADAMLKAREMK